MSPTLRILIQAVAPLVPYSARRACVLPAIVLAACTTSHPGATVAAAPTGSPRVGPVHGSVMVVGGGAMGPEVYAKFIQLAGGPDAVIIDVPTAAGDSVYPPDWRGANGFEAAGAKHVVVLHTLDRKVADSDSFIAPLKNAGGVRFEGGRHYHLVDSYLGTKTERAFHGILDRGGVMAGSSAGASILGSYLVRGAPSNDNRIMAYPGYETGFGFLRGVGIDQHVVARERLADLADSVMPRHPEILGISEDEGTVWVVQGDSAEIIGRDKAFVYGGKDPTDPGKAFLTLYPGDKYNLAARHVTPRAIPNFPLLGLSAGFNAAAVIGIEHAGKLEFGDPFPGGSGLPIRDVLLQHEQSAASRRQLVALIEEKGGAPYTQQVTRRIFTPIGMHKTVADSLTAELQSNVDELYRWELGLTSIKAFREDAFGWRLDSYRGSPRESEYGTSDGKRNAFVRFPSKHAVIIVLTGSATADARALADRIADRLLFQTAR